MTELSPTARHDELRLQERVGPAELHHIELVSPIDRDVERRCPCCHCGRQSLSAFRASRACLPDSQSTQQM